MMQRRRVQAWTHVDTDRQWGAILIFSQHAKPFFLSRLIVCDVLFRVTHTRTHTNIHIHKCLHVSLGKACCYETMWAQAVQMHIWKLYFSEAHMWSRVAAPEWRTCLSLFKVSGYWRGHKQLDMAMLQFKAMVLLSSDDGEKKIFWLVNWLIDQQRSMMTCGEE